MCYVCLCVYLCVCLSVFPLLLSVMSFISSYYFFSSHLFNVVCLTYLFTLCHSSAGTGTCQSPGSCPYHPVKEKKSHQHASCTESAAAAHSTGSTSLSNSGATGLTGIRKSSSLENLDCLMQDLQKLQLASQSDTNTSATAHNNTTGLTTTTTRLTVGAHNLHHTPASASLSASNAAAAAAAATCSSSGNRSATLRVSRASRVKNESFRAAVDRSYDTTLTNPGNLTIHQQQQQQQHHGLSMHHHSTLGDPSNMETGELLALLPFYLLLCFLLFASSLLSYQFLKTSLLDRTMHLRCLINCFPFILLLSLSLFPLLAVSLFNGLLHLMTL